MATTTQQKLDEALEAKHLLAIGQAEVSVQIGTRKVEFSQTTVGNLDRYIAQLRRELGGKQASSRGRIRYVAPQ